MGNTAKPFERGRAWIEINPDALAHNLTDIRLNIPQNCEVMAIVKANAYGHGVEIIAGRLKKEGIKTFAVATVTEAIQLRQVITEGTILVLGYTHPEDISILSDHKLSQLVMDEKYAKKLNDSSEKLNIHIAIDTGMHRLGLEPTCLEEIESIYNCKNLIVEGIATHLATPDAMDESGISFTREQMEKLSGLVRKLKDKGYKTGKIHAQSSYGIYNYPEVQYDFVRPGIMLYGVKSQNDTTRINASLQPVLSLRAVIAQVRWIKAGESVSYGRTYTANKPAKIATVSIGYADGIPRQLSGSGAKVIIKGQKVPIIGRICMDMLIVDVTDIDDVEAGDIATIIGKDGKEEIRAEDVAEAAGTITNDLLSGLSSRLPRICI